MSKNRKKLYQMINKRLGVIKKDGESNVVTNLMKRPQKEKVQGKFHDFEENATHQADLLFLPHDSSKGGRPFKYALVVVDNATRKADARPLRDKTANTLRALLSIYNGKYLKKPTIRMETDDGSEFKGVFDAWLKENDINHKWGRVNRHRAQALVEGMNRVIGTGIGTRQNAQEMILNETSREWVDDLKDVIEIYNEHVTETRPSPEKRLEELGPPSCKGTSCKLLDVGTKVRVIKERPTTVVKDANGKEQTLSGTFRATDTRWESKIRSVIKVIIKPGGGAVKYKVSGDDQTATRAVYGKEELQVVDPNEKGPRGEAMRKHVPEKIVRKVKKNKKWYYEIKWKGWKSTTLSLASHMKKDRPDLVREFEKRNK